MSGHVNCSLLLVFRIILAYMTGFSTNEPPDFADSMVNMMRQQAQEHARLVLARGGGPLIRTNAAASDLVDENPEPYGTDPHAEIIRRGRATDERNEAMATVTDDESAGHLHLFSADRTAYPLRPTDEQFATLGRNCLCAVWQLELMRWHMSLLIAFALALENIPSIS